MNASAGRVYRALGHLLAIGDPPSERELAMAVGLSVSTVHAHLDALRAAGWVTWAAGRARSLRVAGGPLAAGQRETDLRGIAVPAGPPAPTLAADGELAASGHRPRSGQTFLITATGDSMTGAGIHGGDTLVVRLQRDADHGDVVLATVPAEPWPDVAMTVKRLDKHGARPRLLPANSAFGPIEVDGIAIIGKVVEVRHGETRLHE